MNEVKKNSSPWAQCIILCCRTGPIFRASYGTSHGQNNISMVVTRTWRQDESRIKIKTNEYKWCLLHLEEGINHTWANVFSLPLSLTFSHHILMLSLSRCFSYSGSLHLIELAIKCPSVLIICSERWGRIAVVFSVCRREKCHCGEIHKVLLFSIM